MQIATPTLITVIPTRAFMEQLVTIWLEAFDAIVQLEKQVHAFIVCYSHNKKKLASLKVRNYTHAVQ